MNTEREKPFFIHPSAIVEEPNSVGQRTKIWHFCHVMKGAHIGEYCILGQNTFVEHALSANKAANEAAGYADDPLWGQFVTEIDNLHPLDDLKTVDFAECVEAPLKNLLTSVQGEAGADMDIQAELDDIAATADECLAQ